MHESLAHIFFLAGYSARYPAGCRITKKAGYLVQPYTIAINIYFLHIPAKT